MSDLIREIDEEVAKEKSEQFIEKWGLPIGIFIVILLVGLFMYFRWNEAQTAADLERANNFDTAIQTMGTEPETAAALFADLTASTSGFAELSEFKLADTLWNQGKHDDAMAAWIAYAQDTSNNVNMRNHVRFKIAWFGAGLLSDEEVTAEITYLETLLAYQDFTPILRSLLPLSKGDVAEAQTLLSAAAQDEDANEVARNLAQSILGLASGL